MLPSIGCKIFCDLLAKGGTLWRSLGFNFLTGKLITEVHMWIKVDVLAHELHKAGGVQFNAPCSRFPANGC
jgi:hypothetical protein